MASTMEHQSIVLPSKQMNSNHGNGMLKVLKNKIQGYKYRFVPWQILNWNNRSVKKITALKHKELNQQNDHVLLLQSFFEKLYLSPEGCAMKVTLAELGFSLKKRVSCIQDAGTGVFVNSGMVKSSSIVAMYPGTIYYPMEPLFFASINNQFILKCLDGIMVDGNDKGISRSIYKSSAARDVIGSYLSSDTTWLSDATANPLAVGQYVNNGTHDYPANVIYQEVDIPVAFPLHLRKYIPNTNFAPLSYVEEPGFENTKLIRSVVLLALRDIHEGEELLSSYFTEVY